MSNDSEYKLSLSLKEKIKRTIPIREVFEKHNVVLYDDYSKNTAKCLCPFHGENTPSCYVDYEQGLFYCFGCKSSGDIFDFVKLKYDFKSWYDIINYFCIEYNINIDGCDADLEEGILKHVECMHTDIVEEDDKEINNFYSNVLIVSSLLKRYCDNNNFSKECMDKIFPIYKQIDNLINLSQDKNYIKKSNESMLLIISKLMSKV